MTSRPPRCSRGRRSLRAAGCALAAGPVDGDTWHRYRLVTWSDGTPPFSLEPFSPLAAVAAWRGADFTPLETAVKHYVDYYLDRADRYR